VPQAQAALRAAIVLWALAALEPGSRTATRETRGRLGRLAGSMRDRMLDAVDPDEIAERVEINALLDRVDVNALLSRVDVDALLARVDVDALLAQLDVGTLLDRVDVNALLARIDVNTLLDRVDVNALLDRVDAGRLLARVDVGALLDPLDVDRLVGRVDLDGLLARVDVNALVDRLDLERLVQRARIPELVAASTGNMAESAFDLLRRQLLALDAVVTRSALRILRRDPARLPAGPAQLAGALASRQVEVPGPGTPPTDVTGHYAGPVTRLLAHVTDSTVAGVAFAVTGGASAAALRDLGISVQVHRTGILFLATLTTWLFAYWWTSTLVVGRTPGMALVGLRIVTRTGAPLPGRRATIRVLALPVSLLALGAGLPGVLFDRERRALHDVLAGSTVVYDWGDRRATLPTPLAYWLARHTAPAGP
jgi:uncharacterized RDD family membrane protein YckC